jgi:predicted nucleic acid-binding protein
MRQVYGTLTISAEVYAEVVVSGAGFPGAVETSRSDWIQVRHVTNAGTLATAQARSGLGLGELSTIVLAKELPADLVILDDLAARRLARREGLGVQGTIAILEAGLRRGYVSDLRAAYRDLLERGVYLDRALLNRSLQSFKLASI